MKYVMEREMEAGYDKNWPKRHQTRCLDPYCTVSGKV